MQRFVLYPWAQLRNSTRRRQRRRQNRRRSPQAGNNHVQQRCHRDHIRRLMTEGASYLVSCAPLLFFSSPFPIKRILITHALDGWENSGFRENLKFFVGKVKKKQEKTCLLRKLLCMVNIDAVFQLVYHWIKSPPSWPL